MFLPENSYQKMFVYLESSPVVTKYRYKEVQKGVQIGCPRFVQTFETSRFYCLRKLENFPNHKAKIITEIA